MVFVRCGFIALIFFILIGPPIQLFFEASHVEGDVWLHVRQNQLSGSIYDTFRFSLIAILTGGIVGTYLGSATFFFKKLKNVLDVCMSVLIAMPTYVFGFAYLSFFDFSGPIQTLFKKLLGDDFYFEPRNIFLAGVLFGLSCSPYVYFAVRTALGFNVRALYESAVMLGQNKTNAYRNAVLPALFPWIASGTLMIFLEGLSDYGFVDLFGVDTLSRNLFKSWSSLFSFGSAARLGLIILFICITASLLLNRLQTYTKNFGLQVEVGDKNEYNLNVSPTVTAILALILFSTVFIPLGILISNTLKLNSDILNEVLNASIQTFKVSIVSATAVTLTLSTLFALIRKSNTSMIIKIISAGYGVPGTLLAVAYYIFFTKFFNLFFENSFVLPSMLLLCMIFIGKFGGIILRQLENIKNQLNQDILDSASILSDSSTVAKKIEWPQYRSAVYIGFLLVFLEAAKELPATMLTKPTATPTLAMRVHQFASESDWATGSAYSLVLLLLVSAAVFFKFFVQKLRESKII